MKEKLFDKINSIFEYIRSMQLTRFLIFGYITIILIGTFLLTLPCASRAGISTALNESLFTATSATCVTGLVLSDVYTHWSLFGQLVLLCLVQIGGVGFMTVAIFALSLTKHKIGLKSRFTMQESVGAHQVGGIVKMAKWLLLASLAIELIGAFFMSFRFIPKLGWLKGIYFSIFHAVSSFCNAGLDLMGNFEVGSSLTTVKTDLLINIVIMLLIILGGLGFLVWQDLIEHRWHFKFYKLQTKVVLVTSGLLILIGAVVFLVFEFYAPAYKGLNAGEKVLASIFQSVSARTAGFQSVNLSDMNESGQFVMIFLMLIGGSSGSTAGGIKTTTFAVLMISIISVFRRRKSIECFKRRIDDSIVHNACCVMMFYLLLAGFSATIISFIEKVPFMTASFETVSAIATVGLSLGLTPTLSIPSQLIIILLMFIGRIGGLTLILAFTNRSSDQHSQYPVERITVG